MATAAYVPRLLKRLSKTIRAAARLRYGVDPERSWRASKAGLSAQDQLDRYNADPRCREARISLLCWGSVVVRKEHLMFAGL